MLKRILVATATGLLLLLGALPAGAQHTLSAYSTCAPDDSVYVIWTLYDPTNDPYAHPEWVGYDVLRRGVATCEDFVRANNEIIPRLAGQSHERYWGEVIPSTGVVYEYRVIAVDADHQQIFLPGFCAPCNVYQPCPQLSTPITIGTIEDWGWAVAVMPCPGTCYPGAYIQNPVGDPLRPYAGTGTAFRFFGAVGCGTVEGCSMGPDHWEAATCVTPTVTRTWGRLKTIYR